MFFSLLIRGSFIVRPYSIIIKEVILEEKSPKKVSDFYSICSLRRFKYSYHVLSEAKLDHCL